MTSASVESPAQYAMFTADEMDRRYDRARELMAQKSLDVLLISQEENFQYYAGATSTLGYHYSNTRPTIFILPISGGPIIIVGKSQSFSLELTCHVKDIRGYTKVVNFPWQMVVEAIKDAAPDAKRVGAELGQEQRMGMPVGDYLSVVEGMPGVEFADAADLIIKQKMIKSAAEVAYMKQAADITGRARQKMFDYVVPGMTERDVVRLMRKAILEEGGDRTSFVHLVSELPGCHSQFHFDRPLKKGNALYVDAGAYVRTYTVDYPRFATLGKATDDHKRHHEILQIINKAMVDALRPGLKCSDIFNIGAKVIEEQGFEVVPAGRMGHGQGILLTEPPSISADDDTVLEPGLVISTEPAISLQWIWEDVHVITEDGHEQLTLEPPDLREITFD